MEQNKPAKVSPEKYFTQIFKFFDFDNDELLNK